MSVLRTVLERIRYGGNVERRTRRYVATGAIACASVWVLSLGYLALAPKTYTSGFVLVMPGTATGASVNLPTLGQAQSTSSSPFASAELSPTENYRKMLLNNRLIEMASAEAGEAKETFPLPKVELADQTKLISLKVTGRTPEQAAKRADAIRRAFLSMLDTLRIDEIKQSLRIIDQCLHQMPDGPVMAKLPRLLRPRPGRAFSAVEAPRGEFGVEAIGPADVESDVAPVG